METEVKLAFNSKEELFGILDTEWFGHYCLDTSEKEPMQLSNTYYDTDDRIITNRGGSIRVRLYESDEESNHYEHTVKFGGSVNNGLHQRYEWNNLSESNEFNFSDFRKAVIESGDPSELLDEVLEGVTEANLKPLVSTEFERTIYVLGFGDSMMEACFDYGKIIVGDKFETICELEIELTEGDVVDLQDLASYIADHSGATPYNDSKFHRCLRLLDEE